MVVPFNSQADTFKIDVTSTASTGKLISKGTNIRIVNDSFSTIFISISDNSSTLATLPTTTATRTCTPILGGSDISLSLLGQYNGNIYISAISKSGETATIYIQVGEGV